MTGRPAGPTAGRLAGWLVFVGVLGALNYAARFAVQGTGTSEPDFFYRWDTFAGGLVQLAVMTAVLTWIVYGGPAAVLLAVRRPDSWGKALGRMALILGAILILGAVLNPFLHPGQEQGLVPTQWHPQDAAPFVANLLLTTLGVPVVEELTFRGAGFSLLARYGRPAAIGGTGLIFGLAHGLVLALPILVAFGIALAWLRSRSASVYPGMFLHGTFNAVAILLGVFG